MASSRSGSLLFVKDTQKFWGEKVQYFIIFTDLIWYGTCLTTHFSFARRSRIRIRTESPLIGLPDPLFRTRVRGPDPKVILYLLTPNTAIFNFGPRIVLVTVILRIGC